MLVTDTKYNTINAQNTLTIVTDLTLRAISTCFLAIGTAVLVFSFINTGVNKYLSANSVIITVLGSKDTKTLRSSLEDG